MAPQEIVTYLSRSIGVTGSAVISGEGKVLARELPDTFDPETLPAVFRHGCTALEALRRKLPSAYEIRLDTNLMTFFLRDLNGAFLVVLVYDTSKANSAKISIDVVAKRYQKMSSPRPEF